MFRFIGVRVNNFVLLATLVATCSCWPWTSGNNYQYSYSSSTNGGDPDQISAQLNEQLAPLQDLGARINAQVAENLKPLEGLGDRIRHDVQIQQQNAFNMADQMNQMQQQMQQQMQAQMAGLNNLGAQIQANVNKQLEPVQALGINAAIRNGNGGTTIVTYLPGGRQFIRQNGVTYTCSGTIDNQTGRCNGNLNPFNVQSGDDYCYCQTYSISNGRICLNAVSVVINNDNVICNGTANRPSWLTTLKEYADRCKSKDSQIRYRYIANPNDFNHVQIPNSNPYVKCDYQENGICEVTDNNPIFSNTVGSMNVQSN